MKALRIGAGIALAAMALGACGDSTSDSKSGTELTLRFATTVEIPGTVFEASMGEFEDIVEDATEGTVKVQVLRGAITAADLMQSLRDGRVEGGNLLTAYTAATEPTWDVAGLPGVLDDTESSKTAVSEVIKPFVSEDAKERFGASLAVMSAFPETTYWTAGKKLETLDDFKGTRLRGASAALVEQIKSVGGAPVGLEFGEVYSSVERRIVDGATVTMGPFLGANLHEVMEYGNQWPAGHATWGIFLSEEFLAKLDAGHRAELEKQLAELEDGLWDRQTTEHADAKADLEDKGIEFVVPTADELEAYMDVTHDVVYPWWAELAGSEAESLLTELTQD